MKIFLRNSLVLFCLSLMLFSCASRKDLAYLQGIENQQQYNASVKYEPTLQSDDLLSVIVSAENPEVTYPFNIPQIQGNYEINKDQSGIKTYLIDNDGFIDFPVIGKIKLGGLTRTEATAKLAKVISLYITNPSINLRILNYKISVLGEVQRPGSYTIPSERITVLEALGLAGDLTIFGLRKNVLLIHDEDGKKTFTRMDLTDANLLNSPSYYLAQNDVLVVEPNKTRMNSSKINNNTSLILSAATVLISFLIFLKR